MRYFDDIIFMGSCGPGFTQADIRVLRRRLNDALSLISGMQQGADISKEDDREDIVRDIAAALLGKNIEITDACVPNKELSNLRHISTGERWEWHEEMKSRRAERLARKKKRESREPN
jgi:hypothetical protein